MPEQQGWTAPGFEDVRIAFEQNFAEGLEVGAAFSAYHRGQKVVDLWGGIADEATGRPWEEDAIILVFSTTKGLTAVCANKLAQEGRLDVDAPVVQYWPEFGANGKESVPVSYLLSHQTGLYDVDAKLTVAEVLAWEPVVEALAAASAVLGARLAARLPRDYLRLARRRGRAASLGTQHRDVLACRRSPTRSVSTCGSASPPTRNRVWPRSWVASCPRPTRSTMRRGS